MEDKLNALLENPDAMSRIMNLAKQLSGDGAPPKEPEIKHDWSEGGLDPKVMTKLLPLLQEFGRTNSQSSQLLFALRPYLKEERQNKVDRAIKLAHIIHIAKCFLAEGGLDIV